ncbi:NADPH-dependent assimilatory sulfite reductase hemoprotein subunit [Sphingomonas ginkgonis]|uniref:assimilatory sulfite reductase (NADPH) n=1 Tax=Sphingomonas ginkgonis TaxID=2315330 RepID=A0A429V6C9_9SPHN|nr:NADPH-dependent assimilatory sulfite reductase hemoprotein subunit [Sphingomonas ginkgonis]RST29492.1 NADPH-dependent assimilatory sulfite reductase hemoprotein subunit [Sphingomonas ginkgonis]
MTDTSTIDRSKDVSQPVERLGPDEALKLHSNYLRGHIDEDLLDRITGGVTFASNKLMKFHGIYQQDDRDIRDERRRQKLEPAHSFMVRVRLPGGICTPEQWLKVDELARAHGGNTIRLTTRQTFQFHWIVKEDIKPTIQGLQQVLLDTVAACGDDARTVMATADPLDSDVHAEVAALSRQLSDHVIPKTRAYAEIWYGQEKVATTDDEEPFYGRTYLPRKFKIGFAVPPFNDIDIYTQDMGFIAIVGDEGVEGFNLTIGGGMGRNDQDLNTYARLGDVVGYFPKERLLAVADAVMSVQRDYGNRAERSRARFKYTVDDKGLGFIVAAIEERSGAPLEPVRPFAFESNGDAYGWRVTDRGLFNYGLFIENGRIAGRMMDGIAAIARVHSGQIRLTPNQSLNIAGIEPARKPIIEALLSEYGLLGSDQGSALRLNSMACVALPTCPLAMAEAERYLPELVTKIEGLLAEHGLSDEPITIRMTGCPNGCARPYVAEIALTGRAPGKYNLWLGAGFHGQRLSRLVAENIGEATILDILSGYFAAFAERRKPGQHFGDFVDSELDRAADLSALTV